MPVTLKEVAERAGVSRSAVSRTFTEGASVSQKTRKKVEKAANELGYSPNALASSLTTGRTKLIGLISNQNRRGRLETGQTVLSSLGGDFTDQLDQLRNDEAISSVIPLMRR